MKSILSALDALKLSYSQCIFEKKPGDPQALIVLEPAKDINLLTKALRIALKELNECCACDEYQCDYCFALKEIEALFKEASEGEK